MADAAEQVKATFISVDHHRGSEEHQLGQEYHDPEEYDERLNRINTYPSFEKTWIVCLAPCCHSFDN